MGKIIKIAIAVLTAATVSASVSAVAQQFAKGEMRLYCTQFGPFHIMLDGEKGAGVYRIIPNDHIGSVIGVLEDQVLTGSWSENESGGAIRISFSGDWSSFEAAYSIAPDLEDWQTGWQGYLPPAGKRSKFEIDGEEFFCE